MSLRKRRKFNIPILMTTGVLGGGGVVPSPLLTDLVEHWSLEEASGNRTGDYAALVLTDNNTVTQNTGKVGNAAVFTAANSESLSRTISAPSGGVFEMVFWVYLNSVAINQGLMGFEGTGSEYLYIGMQSTLVKIASLGKTGGVGTTPLSTSTWYMLGLRWDLTQFHAYINTSLEYSVTPSSAITWANLNTFYIGGRAAAYGSCRIDQAARWNRELTATERTWLYNSGNGRSWTDVQAYTGV